MLHLEFNDPEEFEVYFDPANQETKKEVTEAIYQGIKDAIIKKLDEAELFSISFTSGDDMLDVTLKSSEWSTALENCQEKFHELEMFDEAIDVYTLRKDIW